MEKRITREYNYSDVYLVPNKCIVESRSQCDTSVILGKHKFASPVIAANMKTVVDINTCKYFASKNWFFIMHRFGVDPVKFIDEMKSLNYISSISIGVNDDTYAQLREIKKAKLDKDLDYACLDIAHADSPKAEKMIKYFKDEFPETFLISGNVATPEAVERLEMYGTDATKIGISNGSVCETFKSTGFGRPQLSTDLECCAVAKKPIISDGAASTVGDIVKSLVAGSSMKMCGNLFAGYNQSAGEIIEIDGRLKKQYFGSASKENKGKHSFVEGKRILIDYRGDMDGLLYDIQAGIASGISYAGGTKLSDLNDVKIVSATPRNW